MKHTCHRNLIVWPHQIEPLCRPLMPGQPHGQSIGIPVQAYSIDSPRLCQIMGQSSSHISECLLLVFPRPGTPPAHFGVPNMNPAAVLAALDVGHPAVKPPVPLLVTKSTFASSRALLIAVVSVVGAALTAVPCGPNFSTHCFLLLLLCAVIFTAMNTQALP